MKIALTIAGSDSGGGAGIQADLKTFHQFGVFGTSVVTAVTAQDTLTVSAVHPIPADVVNAQMAVLAGDLPPQATKSGMLATPELVDTVARGIRRYGFPNYVLDPVMVASSGARLLEREAERLIARELMPLAVVVTPNLDEAGILTGEGIKTIDQMEQAGRRLIEIGARAVLLKGGHLEGDQVVDILMVGALVRRFTRPKIVTAATHGTGCTLSAGIAAGLALGWDLPLAVERALDFVHRAILTAPGLGRGHGPLNHGVGVGGDG